MVHITNQMTGLDSRAIADILPDRPLAALKDIGVPESRICVTNDPGQAEDALRRGLYLVTEDALILPQLESLEVVVEATGVTEVGSSTVTSSCPMRAFSLARRMWQAMEISHPPPRANPFTAAIEGFPNFSMALKAACPALANSTPPGPSSLDISPMSAPATKALLPLPVMISTRTAVSAHALASQRPSGENAAAVVLEAPFEPGKAYDYVLQLGKTRVTGSFRTAPARRLPTIKRGIRILWFSKG